MNEKGKDSSAWLLEKSLSVALEDDSGEQLGLFIQQLQTILFSCLLDCGEIEDSIYYLKYSNYLSKEIFQVLNDKRKDLTEHSADNKF